MWKQIKSRLIDIDRQTVEAECAGKTTLVVQAELKVEWGTEKYINYLDGEERRAIAWLRLGDGCPSSEKREWYTSMSLMQRAG